MPSLTIFICYARRDIEKAKGLYDTLHKAGFSPWLDKYNLLPGENWEFAIRKAIRSSTFFLVLLTKHSVDKRGYLQKEIKEALSIQDEKLDGDRYIIPARLEDCEIPDRLSSIHAADLHEAEGWGKLLDVLRQGSPLPVKDTQVVLERPDKLPITGLPSPCFFPSISSVAKSPLSVVEYLEILITLRYPMFLISAFDLFKANRKDRLDINKLLDKATTQGQIIEMLPENWTAA